MTEEITKLISYPDDKLSINRYICYLEMFDCWFMHAEDADPGHYATEYSGRALVGLPKESVQVEIYLYQHKMTQEQLNYALDKEFCYNKRFKLESVQLTGFLKELTTELIGERRPYRIEYLGEPDQHTYFHAANDVEVLKHIDAFMGSINN